MLNEQKSVEAAKSVFRQHGGILRTSKAIDLGIHPRILYRMRDSGILDQLARGVYRLSDLPPLTDPDLVTVATKIPDGVVCLISALAYHELTTQIPAEISIALKANSRVPALSYPPIRTYWYSKSAYAAGVERHKIDDVDVKIYSIEKTIADCFKFRNRIGMDTVLEALSFYFERRKPKFKELMQYARICRVEKIIRPYLESNR